MDIANQWVHHHEQGGVISDLQFSIYALLKGQIPYRSDPESLRESKLMRSLGEFGRLLMLARARKDTKYTIKPSSDGCLDQFCRPFGDIPLVDLEFLALELEAELIHSHCYAKWRNSLHPEETKAQSGWHKKAHTV